MFKTIAKIMFWAGALAIAGSVMSYSGAVLLYSVITAVLLMIPYLYLQVQAGKRKPSVDAEAA